ncbi:hypothetical protein [Sinorhizobium meliloti]|uniref:hypothetical protein n=1 Tax=Rhizobium meliloti TaxID=382 RepID=UPI002091505E|nr:hypothetical protein [Sinorhizobium meliloti]MCO5966033.1 hypothetical protein [Sinorhizobium meliloti]
MLIPLSAGVQTGDLQDIQNVAGRILISAENGTYELIGTTLRTLLADPPTQNFEHLQIRAGNARILIGTQDGLHELIGNRLKLLSATAVADVQTAGERILVGARGGGVHELQGIKLALLSATPPINYVWKIRDVGGRILVAGQGDLSDLGGIYELKGVSGKAPRPACQTGSSAPSLWASIP